MKTFQLLTVLVECALPANYGLPASSTITNYHDKNLWAIKKPGGFPLRAMLVGDGLLGATLTATGLRIVGLVNARLYRERSDKSIAGLNSIGDPIRWRLVILHLG